MTIQEIVKKVTSKEIGPYIDNGFYVITRAQAARLCCGKVPHLGYEKTMKMNGDTPEGSSNTSTHEYVIAETRVTCRTDIPDGFHWSIRACPTSSIF